MQDLPPLGLYLHFPWCVAKCPYCDFNSHSLKGELPATEYVDALLTDLDQVDPVVFERPLQSVFMGGGTPSLFPAAELQRLLSAVEVRFEFLPDIEITLEANPGAIEHASFGACRDAGINRLSLGVQSFADTKLTALGRIHDGTAAIHAFEEARKAGFDNINLDLMYALPEQSLAEAAADVQAALSLEPEHISYYHLTLEPNTVFYQRPPTLPDADLSWDMQEQATRLLTTAGYENYEVSAWGRPDKACRHNLNYWRYGDYLGLGAGSHGKLVDASGELVREVRAAHPREYLRKLAEGMPHLVRKSVPPADRVFEFMLNNLRLRAGFRRRDFVSLTGLPLTQLEGGLELAKEKQLLTESPEGLLRASELGWRFLDDLQALFLPAE